MIQEYLSYIQEGTYNKYFPSKEEKKMPTDNTQIYLENTYHIQNLLEMNIDVTSLGKLKTSMIKDKLNKVKAFYQKKDFSSAAKALYFIPTTDLKSINKIASENIDGFDSRQRQLLSIISKNKSIKPQFQEAIATALAIPPDISKSKKAATYMAERTYGVVDFMDDVVDLIFISILFSYFFSLILSWGATLVLSPLFIVIMVSLLVIKLITLILVVMTRAGGN